MIIQRNSIEARNALNFTQVRASSAALQQDQLRPLFKERHDVAVGSVLEDLKELRSSARDHADDDRLTGALFGTVSTAGLAGGIWAATSGHPVIAAGAGLAALSVGFFAGAFFNGSRKHEAQGQLIDGAHGIVAKAADEMAAGLIGEGPGPDLIIDRRYFTGGVVTRVATVHSRESGEPLRQQVDLAGKIPHRLESNLAPGSVSIRSAQGEQTFKGEIKLEDEGRVVLNAADRTMNPDDNRPGTRFASHPV